MRAIGQVIPALPVALVASVMVRHPGRAFSELELKSEVFALIGGSKNAARTSTFRARITTT